MSGFLLTHAVTLRSEPSWARLEGRRPRSGPTSFEARHSASKTRVERACGRALLRMTAMGQPGRCRGRAGTPRTLPCKTALISAAIMTAAFEDQPGTSTRRPRTTTNGHQGGQEGDRGGDREAQELGP